MSIEKNLTPYEKLIEARNPERPNIKDYIEYLFDDFIEMHGDRLFRDDPSIVGGIATFHGRPVTVIGQKKGRTTDENVACNFGMTSPEGYRKARRLMQQAEKFGRPIITFVDTPGAYPGIEAESNGQSNAIAENLAYMSRIKVPTLTFIIGEGNSGGALALAVSDRVWMLENAVYSILSPEGFAAILYKDRKKAPEACEIMKITAQEIKEFGIIDGIVPEGKHLMANVENVISNELKKFDGLKISELVKNRYSRFRNIDGLNQRR